MGMRLACRLTRPRLRRARRSLCGERLVEVVLENGTDRDLGDAMAAALRRRPPVDPAEE